MSEENVVLAWQDIIDSKQTVGKIRNALAGDGGGTVDVAGEPGFIWCRYSADQSKVSKVFNIIAPGIPEDFPIKVGRRFVTDEFEQVLAVDWTQYQDIVTQDTVDNFTTGNHGESHNAASGADPAPIDLRNLVEMRVRAQDVADLTVHVERTQYLFGDEVKRYPGIDLDLSASVPAVAGHRYVFVYVDGATNAALTTDGTIVPLAAAAPIPDPVSGTIPGALVDLENGQTTITEDDIFDWRLLWQITSFVGPVLVGTNAERLALTLASLAELTRFYTTDTDKIWEVWEGAWRLIYQPAALSYSTGAAGTPWTVDQFGNLEGIADLELDKGVGDSGAVAWYGGTNDDLIQAWLDDDAVAGRSDLRLNLADAAGESKLFFTDVNNIAKFDFDSNGELIQTQAEALTNTIATFQTWEHTTTGTAAAGFGSQLLFKLEDAGGALEDAAAFSVEWENAGAAAEGTLIRFWLRKAGAALGPFIEFGATEVVFNESSADIDFRIESDTKTHAFFVEGSSGNSAFGIATPSSVLDLYVGAGTNVAFSFRDGDMAVNNYGTLFNPAVTTDTIGRITNWSTGGFVMNGFAGGDTEAGIAMVGYTFDTTPTRAAAFITGWKPNGANARQALSGTDQVLEIATGLTTLMVVEGSGNVYIGPQVAPGGTSGKVLIFGDNGGDPNPGTNTCGFYGKDVAGTVEAFAVDEAGNAAQLTPHNFDGPVQPLPGTLHWSQYHQNPYLGVKKWYDIERLALAVEALTGEQFIFTEQMDVLERRDWYMDQARQGTKKPMPAWMKGA